MKTLFTFFALLFSITSYSQVQLDSIITISDEYQEESLQLSFTYLDGKLHKYFTEFENELFVTATCEYNDEGDFQKVEYLIGDDIWDLDFFYDQDGLLEYIDVAISGSPALLLEYFYFDNHPISSFIYSQLNDQGEPVEVFRDEYFYIFNTVSIFRISGAGNIETKNIYDDNNRLLSTTSQGFGDSLIYSGNSLVKVQKKFGANAEYMDFRNYDVDASLDFDLILNPSDLIFRQKDLFSDDFSGQYFPMVYGTKVNSSSFISEYGVDQEQWYYSILSSTNDQRVNATPITVFPNPTTEMIQLDVEADIRSFTIYDMLGAEVRQESNVGTTVVNVVDLSSGSYTIVAKTKEEKYYFAQFVKN